MSYFAVFLGGGIGSLLRFGLARWAVAQGQAALWGTLAANVLACALLGYLVFHPSRQADPLSVRLLLATGVCGGFSTFSTFSLEAVTLSQNGQSAAAVGYVGASVVLGLAAVGVWRWVG